MSESLWPHGLQHARPPCPSLSLSLLKVMSIDSVIPSNHFILCHPLLLPSIFPTLGSFPWVGFLHQEAKILEFQLQHQSFQWIFGLVPFKIDWFDFLAIQGILKSLLQHHSSKASLFRHSACFMVQSYLRRQREQHPTPRIPVEDTGNHGVVSLGWSISSVQKNKLVDTDRRTCPWCTVEQQKLVMEQCVWEKRKCIFSYTQDMHGKSLDGYTANCSSFAPVDGEWGRVLD